MSKYDPLWIWIKENGEGNFKLTFSEIEEIVGQLIDHSFLNYKKELTQYGWEDGKNSMKNRTVDLKKR